MAPRCLCVLALVAVLQVSCSELGPEEPGSDVLFPWGGRPDTGDRVHPSRVKRAWIIPPIRVSENSKQVPEKLVEIKSDKAFTSEVIYRLEGPGVDQDPKGLFEVEEDTGWILSLVPLDREQYSSFTLQAFALSKSGEKLETPSTIEIVVVDQNDHRPKFTQSEFVGYVPEFSIPGTAVTAVSATDGDDPTTENALLSYSIVAQESVPPFRINKTMFGVHNETGVIYTRDVGLDREVVEGFRLTLQVADMAGEGLSDLGSVLIHVTDINNHVPRFSPASYSVTAVENRELAEIGRVDVTDEDKPGSENWRAKYTVVRGDPQGHFAVRTDPVTNQGILSVVKPLDYESQMEYELVLTVENEAPLSPKGPQGPRSGATVSVAVANAQEAPRFRVDPLRLSVPESVDPGTILARNIAEDADDQNLRFEVQYDPERWISIDPQTGEIKARRKFNLRSPYVKNNIYRAVIKATDMDAGDDGGVSSSATVELILRETNDFAPVLVPQRGSVCRDAEPTPGLVLSAVDLDLPPQAAPFTFWLPEEPTTVNWTLIQINETHTLLQPLVDMELGLYSVPVRVSDSGTPSLSAAYVVTVAMCDCGVAGGCDTIAMALLGAGAGLSFPALLIIIGSTVLFLSLLFLALTVWSCRRRPVKQAGLLAGDSGEDVRDNVVNYDEQGGGEEDERGYNLDQLRNPNALFPPLAPALAPPTFSSPGSAPHRGKQPLRRDAPQRLPASARPRKPPADPNDIKDFIDDGVDEADRDPNVPPYDTALIYDQEGEGSAAGSLSSVVSSGSDGDQDYQHLNDWGPRFHKLADMYGPH
ncbi:cadherin-15 [Conger conger]|uniref:cadherin-15 n=1 Tax=Conger conger TaxID=82655 RepID=UPI002A5ABC6B|nr:cadherin-15 [Conger conger]